MKSSWSRKVEGRQEMEGKGWMKRRTVGIAGMSALPSPEFEYGQEWPRCRPPHTIAMDMPLPIDMRLPEVFCADRKPPRV